MLKRICIKIAHLVFGIRRFQDKHIKKIAKRIRNKKILELGSGKKVNGKYAYSARNLFDDSNYFLMSDIVPEYGHKIIDITKTNFKEKWDIILCLNVLEHVFDFKTAINNLYNAVKPNGLVLIMVPAYYPLHDEPNDYWRFTEHALRKILNKFNIKIKRLGLRKYPFAYFVIAAKNKKGDIR